MFQTIVSTLVPLLMLVIFPASVIMLVMRSHQSLRPDQHEAFQAKAWKFLMAPVVGVLGYFYGPPVEGPTPIGTESTDLANSDVVVGAALLTEADQDRFLHLSDEDRRIATQQSDYDLSAFSAWSVLDD